MTYPMSDEDRAIQERARRFVDEELIPYEVDAEMNQGELPPAVKAAAVPTPWQARARRAIAMPCVPARPRAVSA